MGKFRCDECDSPCETSFYEKVEPTFCHHTEGRKCNWKEVKDPKNEVIPTFYQLNRFYRESLKTIEQQSEQLRVANEVIEIVRTERDGLIKRIGSSKMKASKEVLALRKERDELSVEKEELIRRNNKFYTFKESLDDLVYSLHKDID
jgi:hypothetical protein